MKYRALCKKLCSDRADTSKQSVSLASGQHDSAAGRSHRLFTLNEEYASYDERAADDRDD